MKTAVIVQIAGIPTNIGNFKQGAHNGTRQSGSQRCFLPGNRQRTDTGIEGPPPLNSAEAIVQGVLESLQYFAHWRVVADYKRSRASTRSELVSWGSSFRVLPGLYISWEFFTAFLPSETNSDHYVNLVRAKK